MSFRLFNIKFYISVPFAVMIAFLLTMDSTGYMSASLFAVTLHEMGHLIAMKLTHCAPTSVKCCIGGVTMVGKAFVTVKDNIVIALSGPIVNIVSAAILWILGSITHTLWILAFSVVQFLVGAVNLLPVKGLDGGTVLSAILQKQTKFSPGVICSVVSIVTACIVLVVGLTVAVKNVSNPSLLLLGIYLIILNVCRYANEV